MLTRALLRSAAERGQDRRLPFLAVSRVGDLAPRTRHLAAVAQAARLQELLSRWVICACTLGFSSSDTLRLLVGTLAEHSTLFAPLIRQYSPAVHESKFFPNARLASLYTHTSGPYVPPAASPFVSTGTRLQFFLDPTCPRNPEDQEQHDLALEVHVDVRGTLGALAVRFRMALVTIPFALAMLVVGLQVKQYNSGRECDVVGAEANPLLTLASLHQQELSLPLARHSRSSPAATCPASWSPFSEPPFFKRLRSALTPRPNIISWAIPGMSASKPRSARCRRLGSPTFSSAHPAVSGHLSRPCSRSRSSASSRASMCSLQLSLCCRRPRSDGFRRTEPPAFRHSSGMSASGKMRFVESRTTHSLVHFPAASRKHPTPCHCSE